MPQDTEIVGPQSKVSLLDQHSELKKKAEGEFSCVIFIKLLHVVMYVYSSQGVREG